MRQRSRERTRRAAQGSLAARERSGAGTPGPGRAHGGSARPPRDGPALAGVSADWPQTLTGEEIEALDSHGMAQLVYGWSRIESLRGRAIQAAAWEALHLEALRALLEALSEASVVPLILKGTALAYQVFDSPELRARGDTDLLIRETDVPVLRHVMAVLGYRENTTSGDEHGLRQATWYRTDAFGCEHNFDIHWSIANPAAFANLIQYDEALPHSVEIAAISEHARGLDRARAMLLACVHRVAHHHDSDRLVWLIDIVLLGRQMSDGEWRRLRDLAIEGKVAAVTVHSLCAAGALAELDLVSRANLPEVRDEPSALYLRRDAFRLRFLLSELTSLSSWTARRKRLSDLAFPSPAYMRKEFGVSNRISLSFFYLVRGVRGVFRLFRRIA